MATSRDSLRRRRRRSPASGIARLPAASLAFAALLAPAPAQDLSMEIQGRADAGVYVPVWGWISQSSSGNLSTGYDLEQAGFGTQYARCTLSVSRDPSAFSARVFGTATTGNYISAATNDLTFVLRSPRQARAELHVRCSTTFPGLNGGSASISAPGFNWTAGGSLDTRITLDLPAATDVTLRLVGNASPRVADTSTVEWNLQLTSVQHFPFAAVDYGTASGARLQVGSTFALTGQQYVQLLVGNVPTAGILIVGLQRAAIPVGPCILRNDAFLTLLLPPQQLYFEAPAIPGLQFLVQGAALAGGNLVASQGIELTRL